MTATPETVEEAAARLEETAPGYLQRIRRASARLAVPSTPLARVRKSVDLVVDVSRFDTEVPILSRNPVARLVKRVVRMLTRFYITFVGLQIAELGEGVSWMGTSLCDYVVSLEAEVAELRERVARLEEGASRP